MKDVPDAYRKTCAKQKRPSTQRDSAGGRNDVWIMGPVWRRPSSWRDGTGRFPTMAWSA